MTTDADRGYCATCGYKHVKGTWWPRHPFKPQPSADDPRRLDAMGCNDGRLPCVECGERVMFGSQTVERPVCGDCLERRTPLKREIASLQARLRIAYFALHGAGHPVAADAVVAGLRSMTPPPAAEYTVADSPQAIARDHLASLKAALVLSAQLSDRWQELVEGRVLAGIQAAMVNGSRSSMMEVLEDLEERIIHASTKGPPLTPAEAQDAAGGEDGPA